MKNTYLFVAFSAKDVDFSRLICAKVIRGHEEVKVFSASHSELQKQLFPKQDYCSTYYPILSAFDVSRADQNAEQ